MKALINSARLLLVMLCLAATLPQLQAQTYTVAGSDTQALGDSWSPTVTANNMTLYSGNKYYLLKSVTYSSGNSYEYKITVNNSWNTSYGANGGGENAKYTVNAGTGFVCYTFDSSTHVPHVVSSLQTVVIAGSDTQALGSSTWNGTNTANSMTTTDGITYTMTKQVDYTSSANMECKAVVAGSDWYGNSNGGNVSYNIPGAGSYTLTYSFNAVTGIVTVDVQSAIPATPNYYITGDNGLGLGGFSYQNLTTMTYDADNEIYTYSYNVATAGTYYFALADGPGSSWDDFNSSHRYGPTSGNETVTLGTWATTQKGSGSYAVTVDAGQVTITFDAQGGRYKVDGTAPVIAVDYYVVGDDTSIFPNGWNAGSENLMTAGGDGTYSWTATGVHLTAGTNYSYKVLGSDNSWHPNSGNATFTVESNGTYNVVFTFDGTHVNAVPTLVQADPTYQYTFYVLLPNGGTPYLYTWNGNYRPNGNWPGTQLSETQTLADENSWYVITGDYSNNVMSAIINLGNNTTQTNDFTDLAPGTYYITWDGSDRTGYTITTEAPSPIVRYYVEGSDTSIFPNGWNAGSENLMTDNGDGTYSWTSSQVNLAAGNSYDYKVYGSDNTWHPDGDNATLSVNVPGTYTVTVTYDSTTGAVNATATLVQAASYFITGASELGLTWSPVPTTALTLDPTTGYYTYDLTVTATGTHGFVLADGQGSNADDWANFNNNYRMGPTSGDQTIELNSDWITTQKAGGGHGAYMITLATGNYTLIYDPASNRFKVVGTVPVFITGSNGLGLGWSYAPATAMAYDETTGLYSYTYNVAKQGDYHFVFATGQVNGVDDEGAAWNTFNWHYRIGPNDSENVEYVLSDSQDNWMSTQMAQIGENVEAGSYYAKLPAGNVTIYFDRENMRFKIESDGQLAQDLYMVGGLTIATDVHYYSPDDGVLMKYDKAKDLYYLNHVTLNTNATFCFSTSLGADGNDWEGLGTRYGNADNDENFFVPRDGDLTAHLMVTGDKINVNMALGEWSDELGEWHMHTAGIYNVVVSLADGWVKLIKTDEFSLFPMNVYLEQTDNVEISNVGAEGYTYSTDDLGGSTQYWPLCAYNSLEGGWNPQSDANHYAVTFVGDTITPDGKKWWHWQVSASIAEVFFTRTNQAPYQSALISRKAGVLWYTWEEDNTLTDHSREYFASSATKLPGNVVVEEGHYYVYYINTVGWETVYCVAWSENTDTYIDGHGNDVQTWPGQPMTCIGIDPMTGYEVWEYDFGAIDGHSEPDNLLFHDGTPIATTDAKEQTGDFEFVNGGVYDYLGMFDDAYTLNSLIRSAKEDVRYTISNDLVGVYYDADAETTIWYHNNVGTLVPMTVTGALYAKDMEDYGEPSELPDGEEFHDYVYDICSSTHTAGKSQIMDKKTEYDQSNWIKLVVSPNYDGRNHNPLPQEQWPKLEQYVNRIIPGGTLDVYMTDSINPTARVMAIQMGDATTYEPNVYVSGHFNDTIVFNYTHREWQPKPTYGGTYRTVPHIEWIFDPVTGEVLRGEVTRSIKQDEGILKMYYVAPKPQEVAYVTWMVYDNLNILENGMRPYGDYEPGEYMPYTTTARFLPQDPGRFYSPKNWDRSQVIPGDMYESLRYLSEDQLDDALGGYGQEHSVYSNGYMQWGAVKVNWSLFDETVSGMPWWQIFQPGQAYKLKVIVRYARGNDEGYQPEECFGPSNGDQGTDGHVMGAPRRIDGNGQGDYANMYFTSEYEDLKQSKFIIFPIEASPNGSNGSSMGNVTTVKEVTATRTIVDVRYYNLMGVESSKPHAGLNIIVTTYSDGSRSSRKVMR